jgi:hypothetical protein
MRKLMIGALALAAVSAAVGAAAEDKKPAKPSGTWVRDLGGDNKITFSFKGEVMTGTIQVGGGAIEFEAAYGVTKTGTVFGTLTKVKKPGDEGPSEGDLFSFDFAVKGAKAELTNLKGTNVNAEAKQAVEGEYKKEA